MGAYLAKRLISTIPTFFGLTIVVFTLLRVLPGDIAMLILTGGDSSGASSVSPDALAALREQLGLNKPIHVQYLEWVSGLVRLDLGNSYYFRRPVMDEIGRAVPYTIELAVLAFVFILLFAIPAGVISAVKQDSATDHLLRVITVAGLSIPSFWLGLLIMVLLVNAFRWLPPVRYVPLWVDPLTNLSQMVWPALAVGVAASALIARMTRSALLEVLRDDYIRTAWAKGLPERFIVSRHALKNAILPVFTLLGISFAQLLGGAAVIETLFNIPGLGRLLVQSILGRDYPSVQAGVAFIGFYVLTINLLVDVAYGWLDPRVRYG